MCSIKKLGPMLLGVLLLTVGCSPKPDQVMSEAVQSMSNAKSYTLVANTKMTTDIEGQAAVTVESIYETKGTLEPEALMSMTRTTTLETGSTNEKEENINYVAQGDSGICYYEKQGDTWYKLTVDGMDMLGGMIKAPEDVIENFMAYLSEYRVVGEVTVDNQTCYEIEAKVPNEKFLDVIDVISDIQDLGLNTEAIEMMSAKQEEFGGLAINFYVDKESKYVVRQSMDLSGMMKIGLQEAFKSEGSESVVNNVACQMDITYTNINNTPAVEIPEEVNSAQEIQ